MDGRPAGDLDDLLACARDRLRIAVVHGGDSRADDAVLARGRNFRPWKSYAGVAGSLAETLRGAGFSVPLVCPDDRHLIDRLARAGINFVWLNTAGVQGKAAIAHTPSLLEMNGLAYLGHDPMDAALLDHKHMFKHVLRDLGVHASPVLTWYVAGSPPIPDADALARTFGDAPFPCVVKPVCGRASLNVVVCDTPAELHDALTAPHDRDTDRVLIEPFLSGSEYCITVTGPTRVRDGTAHALPDPMTLSPVERDLGPGERIFTSMDTRPIDGSRFRILDGDGADGDHAQVDGTDGEVQTALRDIARRIYTGLGLTAVVRLDLRADRDGRLHVLEANPKPDLAPPAGDGTSSLTCAGLDAAGMSYRDLLLTLLADRLRLIAAGRTGVSRDTAAALTGAHATSG